MTWSTAVPGGSGRVPARDGRPRVPVRVTVPTFLVVGAGRSGTTSLHDYLVQHPDVFVPPVKAPSHYYAVDATRSGGLERRLSTANHFVADPDAYRRLFDGWSGERAVGEVSPAYLASPRVPHRIADELPAVRIVAVLRDPVERVRARWVARRRDGLERRDLATVVADELASPLRLDDTAGTYVAAGFVRHVLAEYLDRLGPDAVQVHLFDDLVADTPGVVRAVFSHLGVDPDVPVDTGLVRNRSGGVIANPVLRSLWTRTALPRTAVRRWVPPAVRDRAFALVARDLAPVATDPDVERRLRELYHDEVVGLGELLGRDLGHWLTGDG